MVNGDFGGRELAHKNGRLSYYSLALGTFFVCVFVGG